MRTPAQPQLLPSVYSRCEERMLITRMALQTATELAASKPLLDAAVAGLETTQAELRTMTEESTARTAKFESEKARINAECQDSGRVEATCIRRREGRCC